MMVGWFNQPGQALREGEAEIMAEENGERCFVPSGAAAAK
jgi:hypothetical protein